MSLEARPVRGVGAVALTAPTPFLRGCLSGVRLELGDLRRAGRAGDLEGDLAQRGRGEGDGARPAAGGQDGAGVAVDELPGSDAAGGAGRLTDDERWTTVLAELHLTETSPVEPDGDQ